MYFYIRKSQCIFFNTEGPKNLNTLQHEKYMHKNLITKFISNQRIAVCLV